jgi:hypothetical protein
MAIRMMSGLPERVIQVLKDFLPAELDLIDAEEADSITTPDIGADDYHEWDRPVIHEFPACSIRPVSSRPVEVLSEGFGKRVDAVHRLDVSFHVVIAQATDSDPQMMQDLLFRYITGAMRVLCVTKEALQTTADPTRFVEIVTWFGEATYGPGVEQDDGAIVRSAVLPIAVRRREER